MAQAHCPACFAEVPWGSETCPECGEVSAAWRADHSFDERLVHALGHPISETRMMSIISLAGRRHPATAMPLALCALAHPIDVVQGVAVVDAIAGFADSPQRTAALRKLAAEAEANTVRARAALALNR